MSFDSFLLLLGLLAQAPGGAPQEPADLILYSGDVHTLEAALPRAQAVAVRQGRIQFVGSSAEALRLKGDATQLIDLAGRAVYPGFIDAHGHLEGLAVSLQAVDLVGTASFAEVIARVQARAASLPAGEWIRGWGWDQNDWPDKAFPSHAELSRALPDRPAVLRRVDGHALLANAAAMAAAGVNEATRYSGDGGRILLDEQGRPTGVFLDNAMNLVLHAQPAISDEALQQGTRLAIHELHRHGVTGIHDAGVGTATIQRYRAMARAGEFDLRDFIMLSGDPETLAEWLPGGPVDDLDGTGRLSVRSIKLLADGALGSRGAALLEGYADDAGNRGLIVTPASRVQEVAEQALAAGFQLCVHAIGDRANRMVLDAFAEALAKHPVADHRFRIEHAQVLSPADIPRFAELGVIPSMQAQHQTSDMPWAGDRLGAERAAGAYAWRSLLDTGVIIAGGSDFPVETPDPIAAFRAAVTRQDAAGLPEGGWFPRQCMTREEALSHLTIWPAYAGFAEGRQGSLRPGKLADLVVLSGDLLSTPAEELDGLRVEFTVFAGRVVYTVPGLGR